MSTGEASRNIQLERQCQPAYNEVCIRNSVSKVTKFHTLCWSSIISVTHVTCAECMKEVFKHRLFVLAYKSNTLLLKLKRSFELWIFSVILAAVSNLPTVLKQICMIFKYSQPPKVCFHYSPVSQKTLLIGMNDKIHQYSSKFFDRIVQFPWGIIFCTAKTHPYCDNDKK